MVWGRVSYKYKTILITSATSPVAQWIALWTINLAILVRILFRVILFYIIEKHPQMIEILKISKLKMIVSFDLVAKSRDKR